VPATRYALSKHEFWRMQLLDDLHARLEAIEYEPGRDPQGRRRAGLARLIRQFEEIECRELEQERRTRGRHA
jgi:hypothetical protein